MNRSLVVRNLVLILAGLSGLGLSQILSLIHI